MGPWWPRPLPHRALPGVRYSAPIRPSRQISTAFTREPSILRSRSVYNFILWPAGDKTHFPGETSQPLQISIISIKLLIVLCRRQCFMPHLRSFIKELLPTSFIVHVLLFKRIFNLCSMYRILNNPVQCIHLLMVVCWKEYLTCAALSFRHSLDVCSDKTSRYKA